MNLCIDFGNTKVKVAIFDEDWQRYYEVAEDMHGTYFEMLISKYGVKNSIISSTRNLNKDLIHQLQKSTHLIVLDESTSLPIDNKYETPGTLGKDRLAGVVGAASLFSEKNCVVVDAGTCITMDFIDADKRYWGGNISPGIHMRGEAMHHFTDKLPRVDAHLPAGILGVSTATALQNGMMRSALWEVEGFVRQIEEEYGPVQTIITGGDIKFFEEHLKIPIFASSNLILVGLHEILKFNA